MIIVYLVGGQKTVRLMRDEKESWKGLKEAVTFELNLKTMSRYSLN